MKTLLFAAMVATLTTCASFAPAQNTEGGLQHDMDVRHFGLFCTSPSYVEQYAMAYTKGDADALNGLFDSWKNTGSGCYSFTAIFGRPAIGLFEKLRTVEGTNFTMYVVTFPNGMQTFTAQQE